MYPSYPPCSKYAHPKTEEKEEEMTLSMRRIFLLGAVALIMTLFAGLAQAQPADDAPVGTGGHPHHVHTGDGGCHNIDSVLFDR